MNKAVTASFWILLVSLIFSPVSSAAEDSKGPTLEELAQTPAAKAYIAKQYVESLKEFELLEVQHPQSVLIKRYIASLYDSLGDRAKAVEKLEEALKIDPADLVAHQMIGDLLIKLTRFDKATEHFEYLLNHTEKENKFHQYAAAKIEDIKRVQSMPQTEEGKRLGAQDFMQSAPAKDFAAGSYEKALAGFEELIQKYPEDILLRRFQGITLMRLGKPDQAIEVLKKALLLEPENVAMRFYLGQAYFEKGKNEDARKEFEWVIAHDEAAYRLKAQRAMFQTLGRASAAAAQKKLNLTAVAGYDYDTNAVYKSRDDDFTTAGDQNSGRYNTSFFGSYRAYQKKRFSVSADGLYAQTLYNDFPELQTYTFGGGLSSLYGFTVASKPVYFNLRNGITETVLKNRFYVLNNTLSPSLIFIPHPKVNTTIFHRWAYSQYGRKANTSFPEFYNRNGHSNTVGFSNTIYLNDKRNLYTTFGYSFEHARTRGTEYRKKGQAVNLSVHTPVVEKIEGDVSFQFRDSYYPKTFLPLQRRDDLFSLTVSLTRPLTSFLNLMTFYTYENTKALNNLYEYYKNVLGVQLTLKY